MLITDASDAPQRLGGEESSLYDSLKWAGDVDNALKQGLEETIHDLQLHKREIQLLPRTDVPGRLYEAKVEELGLVAERLDRDDFYKHTADLNTMLTDIKAQTRDAAIGMAESQKSTIRAGKEDICRLSEWGELTQEEQANVYAQLDALSIEVSADLQGLKLLISQEFVINSRLRDLKELIVRQGKQRQLERIEEEKERAKQDGKTKVERSIRLPSTVISADQLDELIRLFQELKKELAFFKEIEVTIKIEG
jgi:hypothetical protein